MASWRRAVSLRISGLRFETTCTRDRSGFAQSRSYGIGCDCTQPPDARQGYERAGEVWALMRAGFPTTVAP